MTASRGSDEKHKGVELTRPLAFLAGASCVAFLVSAAIQADGQRRHAMQASLDAQRARAEIVAQVANGAIVHAWGALSSAADLSSGASPDALVRAAARARPVSGAVLIDRSGAILATSDPRWSSIAIAARRAAGAESAWAGVATTDRGDRALVLTRRIGESLLASVIDTDAIFSGTGGDATAIIADRNGLVLAASPKSAAAPGDKVSALLNVADMTADRFFTESADKTGLAVGRASAPTGALEIYVFAPARTPMQELQRALLASVLPGLAPLLILGALLVMLHRNKRRLEVTEEEKVRTEEHFQVATRNTRAGIFEWRTDTDVLSLSEEIVALLRAPANTLTLKQLAQLAPVEDRAEIEAAFEKARDVGALDATFRVAAAHAVMWIEMRGLAVDEAGDGPFIVGTAVDVTARRDAELRANALQRRLREAIDSFTGPFALWDARRRLLMWNRSYQELFRLDAKVLRVGVSYDSIAMACAPAIRREHSDPNDAASREVELANGAWIQIQERRTAEGGLLTIGLDVSATKRQREALTQSESTLRAAIAKLETSESRNRELARSFEEQKRRAEDASKAKSAFLANMSHELRTPLNAVIGFSEIMGSELYGPLGDERYKTYAKDIHASGQLLLDLINDVLDMAKIEAGKFNLSPRPLDPIDSVEQAVRLVRRRAEDKGLQLIVDAHELPEIEADHRAVKQMMLNLLSNAVKFTDKGGIMVEARTTDTGILLRVIDTGRGIPREHLHRLARPFEQVETQQARDQPGTGLGLALTKSLAEMHGGRLEIDSEAGRGTVVSIFLPRSFGGMPEAA